MPGPVRNMFPYSFNYLKNFLQINFVLFDTNKFVAKICSCINNLNAFNWLFNLIIWEILSPVQFEAGLNSVKLCDKFKILKNLIKAYLFKSIICVFCRGTGFMSGFPRRSPISFFNLSIFKLKLAVSHTFLFSSYNTEENRTSGISSSCRYKVYLLSANFGAHCRKGDFLRF